MISRRRALASATAAAAWPLIAHAAVSRVTLSGTPAQGSLIVGKTERDARVTLDGTPLRVSQHGYFVFGFGYDRTAPAHLEITYADGSTELRDLTPQTRSYETQRINGLPQSFVTPPPDILARIKRETATIHAARAQNNPGEGFAWPFHWPVPGIVSGLYGSQRILNGTPMAPHLGVDIAAPEGTPIHAPAPGNVLIAGNYYLDGGFTLLDHGHGVNTCYVHQQKRFVRVGDGVTQGQVIGLVGKNGRATGPNLHWGFNWFQVALDPSRSTPTPLPPKA